MAFEAFTGSIYILVVQTLVVTDSFATVLVVNVLFAKLLIIIVLFAKSLVARALDATSTTFIATSYFPAQFLPFVLGTLISLNCMH